MQTATIEFESLSEAKAYRDRLHAARPLGRSVTLRRTAVPSVIIRDCEPGTPATYSIGTDSYAGEVYAIPSRSRIVFHSKSFRTIEFTMRKDGYWRPKGSPVGNLTTGFAVDYLDPSF